MTDQQELEGRGVFLQHRSSERAGTIVVDVKIHLRIPSDAMVFYVARVTVRTLDGREHSHALLAASPNAGAPDVVKAQSFVIRSRYMGPTIEALRDVKVEKDERVRASKERTA